MTQRPIKDMATLEAECEEYMAQIRAFKMGGAEPDSKGMLVWSRDVVAHMMDHVNQIAAYNMTAPFVIAALRMVADTIESAHSDTTGLNMITAGIQEVLSHELTAVHIRVPDVGENRNGEDDE